MEKQPPGSPWAHKTKPYTGSFALAWSQSARVGGGPQAPPPATPCCDLQGLAPNVVLLHHDPSENFWSVRPGPGPVILTTNRPWAGVGVITACFYRSTRESARSGRLAQAPTEQ